MNTEADPVFGAGVAAPKTEFDALPLLVPAPNADCPKTGLLVGADPKDAGLPAKAEKAPPVPVEPLADPLPPDPNAEPEGPAVLVVAKTLKPLAAGPAPDDPKAPEVGGLMKDDCGWEVCPNADVVCCC